MLIEKLWRLWKQKRCRHHYKKRWRKEKKSYTMRCMKCGKEKDYESSRSIDALTKEIKWLAVLVEEIKKKDQEFEKDKDGAGATE